MKKLFDRIGWEARVIIVCMFIGGMVGLLVGATKPPEANLNDQRTWKASGSNSIAFGRPQTYPGSPQRLAAVSKPAEVRAKDPNPNNGIQRIFLDGHLYYWREAQLFTGPSREHLTQPLLIHAAGCTNHAPCPVSVQAEVPIGRYLDGGSNPKFVPGVIRAEDLPSPYPMVVTNSLDRVIIGNQEAKMIPGSGIVFQSLDAVYRTPCDHEPSSLGNNNGPTCKKCGKPIKAVYK